MLMHSYTVCPVALSIPAAHRISYLAKSSSDQKRLPLDACRSGKDYAAVLAANVVGKQVYCHTQATFAEFGWSPSCPPSICSAKLPALVPSHHDFIL